MLWYVWTDSATCELAPPLRARLHAARSQKNAGLNLCDVWPGLRVASSDVWPGPDDVWRGPGDSSPPGGCPGGRLTRRDGTERSEAEWSEVPPRQPAGRTTGGRSELSEGAQAKRRQGPGQTSEGSKRRPDKRRRGSAPRFFATWRRFAVVKLDQGSTRISTTWIGVPGTTDLAEPPHHVFVIFMVSRTTIDCY